MRRLRRGWRRLPAWIRYRVAPLAGVALLVGLGWLYFHTTGQTLRDDRLIGHAIILAWATSILIMVGFTPRWSLYDIAVLTIIAGDVLFFSVLVGGLWDVTPPAWVHPLYRSALLWGAVLLVLANLLYLWLRWRAWRKRVGPDWQQHRTRRAQE